MFRHTRMCPHHTMKHEVHSAAVALMDHERIYRHFHRWRQYLTSNTGTRGAEIYAFTQSNRMLLKRTLVYFSSHCLRNSQSKWTARGFYLSNVWRRFRTNIRQQKCFRQLENVTEMVHTESALRYVLARWYRSTKNRSSLRKKVVLANHIYSLRRKSLTIIKLHAQARVQDEEILKASEMAARMKNQTFQRRIAYPAAHYSTV